MSKFTGNQKKLFIIMAVLDGVIVLVLAGLSLAGISSSPLYVPLLLLVSAAGVPLIGLSN